MSITPTAKLITGGFALRTLVITALRTSFTRMVPSATTTAAATM